MKINWNFLGGLGGGVQNKQPSVGGGGGVWIFSGTAHSVVRIDPSPVQISNMPLPFSQLRIDLSPVLAADAPERRSFHVSPPSSCQSPAADPCHGWCLLVKSPSSAVTLQRASCAPSCRYQQSIIL